MIIEPVGGRNFEQVTYKELLFSWGPGFETDLGYVPIPFPLSLLEFPCQFTAVLYTAKIVFNVHFYLCFSICFVLFFVYTS